MAKEEEAVDPRKDKRFDAKFAMENGNVEANGKLIASTYKCFVPLITDNGLNLDSEAPGLRPGEPADSEGLHMWNDEKSGRKDKTGNLMHGRGWIAKKPQSTQTRWFNVVQWGSWRLSYFLACLQRDIWKIKNDGSADQPVASSSSKEGPPNSSGQSVKTRISKPDTEPKAKPMRSGLECNSEKRSKGRPKGSKNKVKSSTEQGSKEELTSSKSSVDRQDVPEGKKRRLTSKQSLTSLTSLQEKSSSASSSSQSDAKPSGQAEISSAKENDESRPDFDWRNCVDFRRTSVGPKGTTFMSMQRGRGRGRGRGKFPMRIERNVTHEQRAKAVGEYIDQAKSSVDRGALEPYLDQVGSIKNGCIEEVVALMASTAKPHERLSLLRAIKQTNSPEQLAVFVTEGGVAGLLRWLEEILSEVGDGLPPGMEGVMLVSLELLQMLPLTFRLLKAEPIVETCVALHAQSVAAQTVISKLLDSWKTQFGSQFNGFLEDVLTRRAALPAVEAIDPVGTQPQPQAARVETQPQPQAARVEQSKVAFSKEPKEPLWKHSRYLPRKSGAEDKSMDSLDDDESARILKDLADISRMLEDWEVEVGPVA